MIHPARPALNPALPGGVSFCRLQGVRPQPTPALVRTPELLTPDVQNVQVASLASMTLERRRQTAVTSVVTLPLQSIPAGTTTWPLPGNLALSQPGSGVARAGRVTAVYLQATYTSAGPNTLVINGVSQDLPTSLTDEELFFATDIPLNAASPTLVLNAPGLVLSHGFLTLHIEVDRLQGVAIEPVQEPSITDLSPFVALDLTQAQAVTDQDVDNDRTPALFFFDSIRDVVAGAPMTLESPALPDPLTALIRQMPHLRPQALVGGYLGAAIAGSATVQLISPAGTLATVNLAPATFRATTLLASATHITGNPSTSADDWDVVFSTTTTSRRFVAWVVMG